ncbi:MAG: hypothetical protein JEZ00_05240 [Anaerolineaceae bacterium]|nr:hypothetical protein [Anaerolineaceae bacterium]
MQDENRFVGGMSGQEVDPKLLQEVLFNVMKQTSEDSVKALETFTKQQQHRAERLNQAAKALHKKHGEEHPDVLAVERMAKSADGLKSKLGKQTKRVKSFPKVRSFEWVVFGTVRDESGQPATNLVVRVFDKDRKYDDLLGETETDANGDFSIIYHERDFKESNEDLPELYVLVTDAKGKLLYTSRDNLRFNAGQSEYFAIRLGTQTKRKAATKKKSTVDAAATTIRQKKGSG